MSPRQRNIFAIIIAVSYFVSVYFAASALVPGLLALQIALLAVILALAAYLVIGPPRLDQPGLPWGMMLLALPVICVLVGVFWWILRWLGLGAIR